MRLPAEPRRRRLLGFTPLVWFLLLPSGLMAQAEGRWKLTLDNGPRSPLGAELVVAGRDGTGSILLEVPDSARIPLVQSEMPENGGVRLTNAGAAVVIELVATGDRASGSLALGSARYRVRGQRLDSNEEYYPSFPAFTLRQLVVGSDSPRFRIPGRWIAAMEEAGITPAAARAGYQRAASAAGLSPLTPDSLVQFGLYRAMGVFRRDELRTASVRTLETIRAGIVGDTVRARFDYLFRPGGEWLVDIHDVALARARRAFPALTWESARPALQGGGALPAAPSPSIAEIPLALYRLYHLKQSDSAQYRVTLRDLRIADPSSAGAVEVMVQGYESAAGWYLAALRFLLEQPWFDPGAGPQSLAERVTAGWGSAASVPRIAVRVFGYPEGSVRTATASAQVAGLVAAENEPAREWLARHGASRLVHVLHLLPSPVAGSTVLDLPERSYRLTSVATLGEESFSGFLEPEDLVLLDPSYQPLQALGTLVHEWQHILHQHHRGRQTRLTGRDPGRLVQPDPYLAEGLAEWWTEQLLAPYIKQFPLLGFGEAEKRATLPADDPHVLGHAMVTTLAGTLADDRRVLHLLTINVENPAAVLQDRQLSAAWRRFAGPDRTIARRGTISIVPETSFRVIDGTPEVVETRIRVPAP